MKDLHISVVMPVYNAERYVAEAVESILAQTFRDLELLVFDDGSTDRSLEILQTYADRDDRVRVFAKPHRGYVPWLNEGLRIARGEFIARMDADDVSFPQRFARQVEYLRRQPDCVAIGCDLLMIDPDGDPLCKVTHDVEHEAIEADLLNGEFDVISHPTCMMRRSALVAVGGYRDKYETVEDFDLWLRLAEHGRLANLPEVLFQYRQHHESVNATKSERQKQLADEVITEARLRRGLKPLARSIWSFTEPNAVWRHQMWARQAAGSGYHRTALKHASVSLRNAPFSPRSWLALCSSLIPLSVREFLKHALAAAGLRRVRR